MRHLVYWLRKPRLVTTDVRVADRSPWQYGEDRPGVYSTSILGMYNGILPKVGLVLVAHYDAETHEPHWPYLSIRRVWPGLFRERR